MKRQGEDGRQPELIEDVTPPKGQGLDVRNPGVKHQAIGSLHQQYLLGRATTFNGFGDVTEHIKGSRPAKAILKYKRVPPLRTLGLNRRLGLIQAVKKYGLIILGTTRLALLSLSKRSQAALKGLAKPFNRMLSVNGKKVIFILLAPLIWLKGLQWIPQKYTLKSGSLSDLPTRVFNLFKLAMPVMFMLIVLAWCAVSLFNLTLGQIEIRHGKGTPHSNQLSPAAVNTSSKTSNGSSGGSPSSGNSSLSGAAASGSGGGSVTLPAVNVGGGGNQPVGGSGGGSGGGGGGGATVPSTPVPTPSLPSPLPSNPIPSNPLPSVPLPSPSVTVPSVSAGPVSTGGGGLTL